MNRAPLTQLAIYGVFIVGSVFITGSLINAGLSRAFVLIALTLFELPLFVSGFVTARRQGAAFLPGLSLKGMGRGLIYYAGVLVFWGAYLSLLSLAGIEFQLPQQSLLAGVDTAAERVVVFLIAGVVGPVLEEVFFRGALFGVMRSSYGFLTGAFISSILFGLAHSGLFVLPMFVFGWLLCYLTETTQSLDSAIFIHIVNNILSLAAVMR